MVEDHVSSNGHGPARRQRKRIYPPAAQMAAQREAAAARPRPSRAGRTAVAEPDFGPEPEAPPAPPMLATVPSASTDLAPAGEDDGAFDADRVELRMSAVGMVDAGDISFSQGALGAARADTVAVDKGAV